MNRLTALLFLLLLAAAAFAQDSLPAPQLVLDFPLADCPYHTYAARTAASPLIACPTCKANAKHNLQAFGNPSMRQSVAYTANVMSAANFGLKKLSEVVVKGDSPMDKFWRIFMQAGTSMGVAGLLYTRPFGPAWTHEEFHRAAMTVNYIGSQDDVWYPSRWGSSSIAVSHVTDTNLIAFILSAA